MRLFSDQFPILAEKLKAEASWDSFSVSRDQIAQLQKQLGEGQLILPDDTIQHMVRSALERDFLAEEPVHKFKPQPFFREQGWARIDRLPMSPLENKHSPLFPQWQRAVSTMHNLKLRLCYVLLRRDGETALYLGAVPMASGKKGTEALGQLIQSVSCQMPGIGMEAVAPAEMFDLCDLTYCGTVTGLPAIQKITVSGEYQTMDQIAMGLRNAADEEQDFAVVILADPITDMQITEVLRVMENLCSEVYSIAQYTHTGSTNTTNSRTDSRNSGANRGINIGVGVNAHMDMGLEFGGFLRAGMGLGANVSGGVNWGRFLSFACSQGVSVGSSDALARQHINKSAQNCVELLNKHIRRLQEGRSLGFWKTGIYVLSDSQSNVETVMGMLRATYSGDDTYMEPIRTQLLPGNSGADTLVRLYHQLPCACEPVAQTFGDLFEGYATPMTTKELAIATSLPTHELPGLRLSRRSVSFTVNPPAFADRGERKQEVVLGQLMNMGICTKQQYRFFLDHLCRHLLIVGASGGGKTVTAKKMLSEVQNADLPFLVIEPAKEEFLTWAIRQNRQPGGKKIRIFAPGFYGVDGLEELHINPFQPTAAKGGMLDMIAHLGRLKSVLMSSIPMEDVVALIFEETLYKHVRNLVTCFHALTSVPISATEGPYYDSEKITYPLLSSMGSTVNKIIGERGYAREQTMNITAAINTRIETLLQGWKGELLNCRRSTDFAELFEKDSVVINLSRISDAQERSLVMSLILIALYEYRESRFASDPHYRAAAERGELKHLTLVDEAHHLMPGRGTSAQMYASQMFATMLKEFRAYGEGMVIADQLPSALIEDAVKNTNLKIVHHLKTADDIKLVTNSMGLRPEQAAVIGALRPGEAIVCSDFDDAAAWVKVEPAG